MIPASIEFSHSLENHEHTVCTSIGEHHIHKQNVDCDEFHKHLTVFSVEFSEYLDVIPQHFYTTFFINKPQVFKEIYFSKKSSRGPPTFTA